MNKQNATASTQANADSAGQQAARPQNAPASPSASASAAALAAAQAARQQSEQKSATAYGQAPKAVGTGTRESTAQAQLSQNSKPQHKSAAASPRAEALHTTAPRAAVPHATASGTPAQQTQNSRGQKASGTRNTASFFQPSVPANSSKVERLVPVTQMEEEEQELAAASAATLRKQTARFDQPAQDEPEDEQVDAPKRATSAPRNKRTVRPSSPSVPKKARAVSAAQDSFDDEEDDDAEVVEKTHIRFLPLFACITAVILIVSCVTVFFLLEQFLFGKFTDVTMPNFGGMKVSDIQYNEDYKNFNIKYEDVYTDETPVGVVVNQNPRAPREVKENTTVTLYVSAGVRTVEVPNITRLSRDEARQVLEDAGLNVIFKPVLDTTVEANTVLNTIPAAGAQVADGETVQVFFSRDESSTMVEVPECVGLPSLTEAIVALAQNGLSYSISEETVGDGVVTAQVPVAGTKVPQGSNVSITLSGAGATGLDALPEKQLTGADGHTHEYAPSSVVSPNEYSIGYTIYTCSVCNYFYYDDFTQPSAG